MHQVVCKHTLFARIVYRWKGKQTEFKLSGVCRWRYECQHAGDRCSERRLVTVVVVMVAASLPLAALQHLGQGVPQLRQLKDLAV